MDDKKRLFFAFEISSPWPEVLPSGRLLQEEQRHMTAAFLGQTNYSPLQTILPKVPLPQLKVGLAGHFDKILFLPEGHPKVVAWHVSWLDDPAQLLVYVRTLIDWLKKEGFKPDDRRDFLPHVTVCRAPFEFSEWRHAFQKIPLIINSLKLYESIGQLHYQPLWSHCFKNPFEELDHIADIAFIIRGETIPQLYLHAFTALAFKFPELLAYRQESDQPQTVDEIVVALNRIIAAADSSIGCPLKAVSFHGEIGQEEGGILTWEMIVDV